MLRSIGAVVLGFVLIGALSVSGDLVLRAAMPDAFDTRGAVSSTPLLLLVQGYVAVFAIFGCYVAARLAPSRPMAHALALGVLGLVFNIVGAIARWDHAPAWYHVLALALVMPYAWLGGRLRERQLERTGTAPRATAAA
jgi:hypothetical protein